MFGRSIKYNWYTVKKIIEKSKSTGSVSDLRHMIQSFRSYSEQNITAVPENLKERLETLYE